MNASSLPRWIDIGLLPVLNLIAALTVAGVIIAIIGENPFVAMGVMIKGAFVYDGALGYTLFYTCLLYTSPSPRDYAASRMPSSA